MESTDERVGEQIRRLREAAGMTKTQLATQLSDAGLGQIHPTTVSRIESGERAIRLSEAVTIASVLGTSVEALIDFRGVETLLKQVGLEHSLTAKSFASLRDAAYEVLERQASLAYVLERLQSVGLQGIERDVDRGRAQAVEFGARELVERKLPEEVQSVVDEWEEAIEGLRNGPN